VDAIALDVATLRATLIADTTRFTAGMAKAAAQSKALERTMGATAKGMQSQFAGDVFAHQRRGADRLISRVKVLGAVTGTVAAVGVAKLAVEGIRLNAQWESITASFKTFTGSAKTATKFVERLRTVSKQSPLRLTEYAEAARMLMGFGVETKNYY